mmetsp:Transcript_63593/g.146272  ORF Transcript_63593/g.146272 Transcript_63593/m.146272 type:complete len:87 (+) Transcript_63593:28-288(+)
MAAQAKVNFRMVLASERSMPYKVVTVPEEAPFVACIKFCAEEFRVDPKTTAVITAEGIGVNPNQTCGAVFLKYGGELRMIPRDRVG